MTITQVVDLPSSLALAPLLPDEIRLVAGGAGWMGTFSILANTLVEDLLSDGAPFVARLTTEVDYSGRSGVVVGAVARLDKENAQIVFVDGTTVEIEVIRSITV